MCEINETVKQIWWELKADPAKARRWGVGKRVAIGDNMIILRVKGKQRVKIEATSPLDYTVTLATSNLTTIKSVENVCCDCLVETIDSLLKTKQQ